MSNWVAARAIVDLIQAKRTWSGDQLVGIRIGFVIDTPDDAPLKFNGSIDLPIEFGAKFKVDDVINVKIELADDDEPDVEDDDETIGEAA